MKREGRGGDIPMSAEELLNRREKEKKEKGEAMLRDVFGFTHEELVALKEVVPDQIDHLVEAGEKAVKQAGPEHAGLLAKLAALVGRLDTFGFKETRLKSYPTHGTIAFDGLEEKGLADQRKTFVDLVREAREAASRQ